MVNNAAEREGMKARENDINGEGAHWRGGAGMAGGSQVTEHPCGGSWRRQGSAEQDIAAAKTLKTQATHN